MAQLRETSPETRQAPRMLGSLELRLMNTLWSTAAELSVQEVCAVLGPHNNYKTVMTVLNRLVEKEMLDRQLDGRAYRYRPRASRDEFLQTVAHDMVQTFVTSYGQSATIHVAQAMAAIAPQHAVPQVASAPPRQGPRSLTGQRRARSRPLPIGVLMALAAAMQGICYLWSRKRRM